MQTGSTELPRKPAPATGSDAVDAEHGIQLGLLEATQAAVAAGDASAQALMEQLHEYSQAHFMSEQLLMRLAARPNYQGHIDDHENLMQDLDRAAEFLAQGEHEQAAVRLQAHEGNLLKHIRSWDRSIAD
ncbi:MAG: hemerythrin domain-containing protein [Xanthomonadales bacterium]|nr:hemerythrin domain-containing protein [Xanthomonadales bacterium]